MQPDPQLLLAALDDVVTAHAEDAPVLTSVRSLLSGGQVEAARRKLAGLLAEGDAQHMSALWGRPVKAASAITRLPSARRAATEALRSMGLL